MAGPQHATRHLEEVLPLSTHLHPFQSQQEGIPLLLPIHVRFNAIVYVRFNTRSGETPPCPLFMPISTPPPSLLMPVSMPDTDKEGVYLPHCIPSS